MYGGLTYRVSSVADVDVVLINVLKTLVSGYPLGFAILWVCDFNTLSNLSPSWSIILKHLKK